MSCAGGEEFLVKILKKFCESRVVPRNVSFAVPRMFYHSFELGECLNVSSGL